MPAVHVAGEQLETQVFVAESQVPLLGQLSPLPHETLHSPSAGSQIWPAGQCWVVQSGALATHWSELVLQAEPAGHEASDVQPGLHASAMGSQYCPAAHPVSEQSGGTGTHSPERQIAPYPQSPTVPQPATQAPAAQCDPYGQPAVGHVAGGVLQECVCGSQYSCPLQSMVPAQPTRQAPLATSQYSLVARHPFVRQLASDGGLPHACVAVSQIPPLAQGTPSAQPATHVRAAGSQ